MNALRILVLVGALGGVCDAALETTLTVLHTFKVTDGSKPETGLVQSPDGWFYGVTSAGGTNGNGVVYKVSSEGTFTTLYRFTGPDGATPQALVLGSDGDFFGTTHAGGNDNGCGTVFKISPAGTLVTLHRFNLNDGCYPGALQQRTNGYFYGDGVFGGTFRIDSAGVFTSMPGLPGGSVALGNDGNYYGTTYTGGDHGWGTVFRITPTGGSTTLYSFAFGLDGSYPMTPLTRGWDGNFYGTTSDGGINNNGTLFRITPTGGFTLLHDFTGSDGQGPNQLIQAYDGNFYTTTFGGGAYGVGGFIQMRPSGAVTLLHSFNIADGYEPLGALVQGFDGSFYGTAWGSDGEAFQLSVTLTTSGSGCVSVDPTALTFPVTGGPGLINVKATADCDWFVVNTNDFIIITSDGGGTGDGAVMFDVLINLSLSERTGVFAVNGHPVTVTQKAFDGFGAYSGLVLQSNAWSKASSGQINLTLGKTGAFTANLRLGGVPWAFTGQFESGVSTNVIVRKGTNPLLVVLHWDATGGTNTIGGSVSDGAFTSAISAVFVPFGGTNPCPWAGQYAFLINPEDGRFGYGYATLVVGADGTGQMHGFLDNGAPFSATSPVVGNGRWPFYSTDGACVGNVTLSTNETVEAIVTCFAPVPTGTLSLQGAKFISPSAGGPPLAGAATVTLSGGYLPANIVKTVTIDARGRVIVSPHGRDKLKLKIDLTTGRFSGTFRNTVVRKTCHLNGQLLPTERLGAGYYPFLSAPFLTGTILIELAP